MKIAIIVFMSVRFNVFKSYANHPWLGRVYAKLTSSDLTLVRDFIAANDSLDVGQFELAVNRMFLDKTKPKRWREVLELLTCCNSSIAQLRPQQSPRRQV